MILTCPSCGTQYVVKDGAIPPEGRQVRCAACKHSWQQEPEQSVEPEPAPQAVEEDRTSEPQEDESLAEATLIEPRSGPEAEERAYEEAALEDEHVPTAEETPEEPDQAHSTTYANAAFDMTKSEAPAAAAEGDWREPPQAEAKDDEFTPFPPAEEAEPRRRSPIVSIMTVVVIVILLAAAFWFLAPPSFKARLGLAGVSTSPLALVTTHMDRQRLESGNELLTVTGRVINPTGKEQDVPPLQAQLKTRAGKVVYSWTIAPPARSLAAGSSASFNSAEVNVPPGGDELTITLGGAAG
ncbi:MAG TPA: MJ0042-type zinc finger domain-containing protein [Sphingomicrobium sp.]|nr:MJ0042-type zinc finger domain-containing protein [Sphingomicrobium sp.]